MRAGYRFDIPAFVRMCVCFFGGCWGGGLFSVWTGANGRDKRQFCRARNFSEARLNV